MENVKKPSYRWIILVCLIMYPFLALIPMMAPAAVLTNIMADLNIGLSQSGLIMMISTVMCGICMFVGSYVESALGARKTLVVGIWLMCLGNLVVFFSPSFAVLMLGRILNGVGWGFCIACGNGMIYQWFEGKEQAYVITIINLVNPAAGALGYAIAIPLTTALGGWKQMFLAFTVVSAIVAVIWTIFIKPRAEAVAAMQAMKEANAQTAASVKQTSPIAQVFKVKQYWVIMIFGILLTLATGAVNSFLPTYLTTEVGVTPGMAATISSITQITGAVGTLISGALVAQTGRRKPFLQIGTLLFAVCILGLTFVKNGIVIATLAGLALAFYYCVPNGQSVIVMESAPNPGVISAAFAMCYGIGQIVTVFNSSIFSKMVSLTGSMGGAMRVYIGFSLLAFIIVTILLKETGPHAKKN